MIGRRRCRRQAAHSRRSRLVRPTRRGSAWQDRRHAAPPFTARQTPGRCLRERSGQALALSSRGIRRHTRGISERRAGRNAYFPPEWQNFTPLFETPQKVRRKRNGRCYNSRPFWRPPPMGTSIANLAVLSSLPASWCRFIQRLPGIQLLCRWLLNSVHWTASVSRLFPRLALHLIFDRPTH